MANIKIKDLLITNSYTEAGNSFYDIAKKIIANEDIIIDMQGVDSLPTIFMNLAFLPLVKDYGKNQVMKRLMFLNIQKSQMERFKSYFAKLSETLE